MFDLPLLLSAAIPSVAIFGQHAGGHDVESAPLSASVVVDVIQECRAAHSFSIDDHPPGFHLAPDFRREQVSGVIVEDSAVKIAERGKIVGDEGFSEFNDQRWGKDFKFKTLILNLKSFVTQYPCPGG